MADELALHPPLKISWFIWTPLALGLFVLIGAYSARMTHTFTDYDLSRAEVRYANLAKLRHDENAILYPVDDKGHVTAEWIDQDKKIVRIPIDEAMLREIDTLKAKPAALGCEILGATPAPAPPPAAATMGSPAPAAATAATPAQTTTTNAAPVAPVKPAKKKK